MENDITNKCKKTDDYFTLQLNQDEILKFPEYRTPLYYESWIWEGDKSVLPYKWMDLINDSKISINNLNNYSNLDDYLKKNFYKNSDFDEKSFFFITHRSHTAGCAYLDKNNIIKFLIVGNNHKNKQVEHSLITRAIKRACEKNDNNQNTFEVKIDLTLTNINKGVFEKFGFK
jgi:hypothetical protein